jgi:hypothetical protein
MTDEQVPPIIEQLSTIHEQVRALVETRLEGKYRVTKIRGRTDALYMQTFASQGEIDPSRIDYILGFTDVLFEVEAVQVPGTHFPNQASARVHLLADGRLHIEMITEQTAGGWIAREERG